MGQAGILEHSTYRIHVLYRKNTGSCHAPSGIGQLGGTRQPNGSTSSAGQDNQALNPHTTVRFPSTPADPASRIQLQPRSHPCPSVSSVPFFLWLRPAPTSLAFVGFGAFPSTPTAETASQRLASPRPSGITIQPRAKSL